ncbi:hypothetical protein ABTY20_33070 [Streptomyces sp. NPDC126497]|uniref:hypothetical protein n=1 Tax=Streptomyces sp. NPDC126497 TaxID=3155313 RepID=UPI00333381C5
MSEATMRALSGERRTPAGMKDPTDEDTLEVRAPSAPRPVRTTPPYGGVARRPEDEGVAKPADARRGLLDAVPKSLDSKGADAE